MLQEFNQETTYIINEKKVPEVALQLCLLINKQVGTGIMIVSESVSM